VLLVSWPNNPNLTVLFPYITPSQDFNLCIWRVYDWQCVHILGGHKDTILDFSVHPTGKMAMSVSKDHTLKLWNLVQGEFYLCVICVYFAAICIAAVTLSS